MIPIKKFVNRPSPLDLAVLRRLSPSFDTSQDPYGFMDDSIYKTYFNEQTGDSEHDLVFSPNVQYHNISPDNIHWAILGTDSNFKGTVDHQTFAEIELLPGYNLQNSNFKVSYIQEGEVFFVKLLCYLLQGYEVNSNNEFIALDGTPEEDRKILHLESNYTILRGYPINTKSAIYINKNGVLNRQVFYTSPIEDEILKANSGDPYFVHDNRTPNHASNISLSKFVESLNPNVGEGKDNFWELDENGVATLKSRSPNTGKTQQLQTFRKTKITLIDDELGMYSHGRGLDLDSIATLNKQNPANFRVDKKVPPSTRLLEEARENRLNQLPGFNAIDAPLINPNLSFSSSPSSGNTSSANTKFYIPGRSSHGVSWEKPASEKVCGTATFEAGGTASTSIYDGHSCTCSSEMCFEIWAECDNTCDITTDACSDTGGGYVSETGNERAAGEYSWENLFSGPEPVGQKYELNPWNDNLTNDANLRLNCLVLDQSLWYSYCGQPLYDNYGRLLGGGTECYDSWEACCIANHQQGGVSPHGWEDVTCRESY